MSLEDDFKASVERMNAASTAPSQVDQLKLYGLFKQANLGDNTGKRPGLTKVRERAKFDAWAANKGLAKEEAMRQYMELVEKLS